MAENKLEIAAGLLVVAAALGFVIFAGKGAGMGSGAILMICAPRSARSKGSVLGRM